MATRTCKCYVEDRPSYELEARRIHQCPLHREAAALVAGMQKIEKTLTVYFDRILSPADRLMASGEIIMTALDEARALLRRVEQS